MRVTYQYNKLGQVTGIGIPGKESLFVSFTYNSAGQVSSEQHLPESANNFTRRYEYNSPGFLTRLEDKFLTEEIDYNKESSYGGYGYGDGTVTRTKFKATWHEHCNDSEFGLNEQSFVSQSINPKELKLCFDELKKADYLDDHNRQTKVYYPDLELKFPIICRLGPTGHQIQNILGKKGFPAEYGYSYDYGNYQELTKAKYFVGENAPSPLQPDTFAKEISGINSTASQDIWKRLQGSGYLIEDNEKGNASFSHGKQGNPFIRNTLYGDLKNVSAGYIQHRKPLERLPRYLFLSKAKLIVIEVRLEKYPYKMDG